MKIYKRAHAPQGTINLSPKKIWQFPGGEMGVKLDTSLLGVYSPSDYNMFVHRIKDGNDLMVLALAKDAVERLDKFPAPARLFLPYVPYARQDRVCVEGESLSIKVFADLINSLKFEKVFICDPHSAVTEAVLNNAKVITQLEIVQHFEALKKRILGSDLVFLSPDAGAQKKTMDIVKRFSEWSVEPYKMATANKVRNLHTGEILRIEIDNDDFKGKDVLICDDICDGGRTFTELAKALKTRNVGKVLLYVTHGIFSKGVCELYDNGIDEIYTTDSYQYEFTDLPNYPCSERGKREPTAVFSVEDLILL